MSRTLDYGPGRRGWGHNYQVSQVIDGGEQLRLAIWSWVVPHDGDYLLLDNNGRETRYRIAGVERPPSMDPDDMYYVDAVFDPRLAQPGSGER
jgi:hypothetical protein